MRRIAVASLISIALSSGQALAHPVPKHVYTAVRSAFGPYTAQALRVAWCESRYKTWASNGQYLGLFQMGTYARSTYGHGSTAAIQAKAAHRYFVASGRDWSPWSCKP